LILCNFHPCFSNNFAKVLPLTAFTLQSPKFYPSQM
jgi:hypothetical protein